MELSPGDGKFNVFGSYLHTQFKDKDALTGTISFNAKGDRVGDVYRYFKFDNKGNIALQK